MMPANHMSARLSALDLDTIRHIPSGGNWKDVPHDIPSKRLAKIRESYARGEGSRSTYYGRLRSDAPAYTINTYFNRPGNGCHIHYGQDRVISQREAARLQSFPDDFVFLGSQREVNVQIGNAVPPLLGFQIAQQMGAPGQFIDLFAGAGGLSLGFAWAGWEPLVVSDIEETFLRTHVRNVDAHPILGDIQDPSVRDQIVEGTRSRSNSGSQLLILGGPPCQGFSTAGKRRSRSDARNHLYLAYAELIARLAPDGFLFENVMGLLNMESGRVFRQLLSVLTSTVENISVWKLQAERYAIPQRRSRVIVVGRASGRVPDRPPEVTGFPQEAADIRGVSVSPTVSDAISDLPPLAPGQDGSHLPYSTEPRSPYQRLARGALSPSEFLDDYRPRMDATQPSLDLVTP